MVLSFLLLFPLFLLALVIHEYSHGWVANKLGDPTAKFSGRLTFNPMAHIDLIGTIILPIFLLSVGAPAFGWAKPVPVNFYFLRNPKRDMFWVAIAGPFANISAAVLLAALLKIKFLADFFIIRALFSQIAGINILLGVFNLLPVPPLDGSRVLFSVLPDWMAHRYIRIERFGALILLCLLWLGSIDRFVWPLALLLKRFLGV